MPADRRLAQPDPRSEEPTDALGPVWGLLDAVGFEACSRTLDVVLRGDAAFRLLGHPADVPIPAADFWGRLLSPRERDRVLAMLREVALDGVPRKIEHLARGGGPLDLHLRTAVLREGTGLRGVMLDVTETRTHERQWHELETWLAALGESLPFDFWMCDRFGRLVLLSPSFARRWQGAPGMGLDQLALPPELMLSWRQSLTRALAGEVVHEQLELACSERVLSVSRVVAPVRAGDEVCGALGVDTDVTDLRAAEHQVRQSLDELGRAQEDLVRREQVAALGEMAAVVAHEVRNPLAAICNATALLRRGDAVGVPPTELLGILEEETFRLEQLVRNMLELARPHRPELRVQPLGPVVEDVLSEGLRYAVSPIDVHLDRAAKAAPVQLYMDAERLSLALLNVIRNAVQAMFRGGDLYVDAGTLEEEPVPWAYISIRDTGEGIPPSIRHRIFEPFFTTRSTGSGMGLVIARRVLTEHGGRLEIESEPGRGTTVTLKLPLQRDAVRNLQR